MEATYEKLRAEYSRAQREVEDARRAGAAVLSAVEGAMAPLMAELASARLASGEKLSQSPRNGEAGSKPGGALQQVEAEIRHLKLDIEHYRGRTERLQVEERKRFHMLSQLRSDLQEASEDLAYEKQRVRHHEVCRQLGLKDGGWVGLGPLGVGKRTLEARAEKKLRESAEERAARLTRDVSRLAGDTAEQQTTIEQLSRRLDKCRAVAREREHRLGKAAKQTEELHARLRGSPSAILGKVPSFSQSASMRKASSASTGKLPQLSF